MSEQVVPGSPEQFAAVNPDQVSAAITFDRANFAWRYQGPFRHSAEGMDYGAARSIADIQAEGTAYLWNLLNRQGLALLADEVGMGKTYQALAVACLLWRQNPQARILVIAPNFQVAENWRNEYLGFIRHHVKHADDILKTSIGGEPIQKAVLCANFRDLADLADEGWCRFFIAKTSSFSHLAGSDEGGVSASKEELAFRNAEAIRKDLGEGYFDLVILDEAHYLRNVGGGSQRVHAARGFFGEGGESIGKWFLLLTATPNHSKDTDLRNVLSYFVAGREMSEPGSLLKEYGLRRLRRLAGRTKHEYRREYADDFGFEGNPASELFVAFYNKALVEERQKSGRGFLYGYLEGFESLEREASQKEKKTAEDEESALDEKRQDFREARDSDILAILASEYYEKFKHHPRHPKYDGLLGKIFPGEGWLSQSGKISELKNLVFVRRIPSVQEIMRRVNREIDLHLMRHTLKAWNMPGIENDEAVAGFLARKEYEAFTLQRQNDPDGEEEPQFHPDDKMNGTDDGPPTDAFKGSRYFDLFVSRNKADADKDEPRNTHASRFRHRFSDPKSPFGLFFELGSDYRSGHYTRVFQYEPGKESDYRKTARREHLEYLKGEEHCAARNCLAGPEIRSGQPLSLEKSLPTLWTLAWDLWNTEKPAGNTTEMGMPLETYEGLQPLWKEGLANWVRAGLLDASPALAEIYGWFIEVETPKREYHGFIRKVKENLAGSLTHRILEECVLSFRRYMDKVIQVGTAEKCVGYSWRFLQHVSPAEACFGATSNRTTMVQAFNSPFFPWVLSATSVLQEGVNLHHQCTRIHHYGIAWTPGDNEQRVGRLDRLQGVLEDELGRHASGQGGMKTLDIRYPYMKGTFDQDQVASFIKKKAAAEHLLDRAETDTGRQEVDLDSSSLDWKRFLREPMEGKGVQLEPYPPAFDPEVLQPDQAAYIQMDAGWAALADEIQDRYQTAFAAASGNLDRGPGWLLIPSPLHGSGDRLASEGLSLHGTLRSVEGASLIEVPLDAKVGFSSELSGLSLGTVYILSLTVKLPEKELRSGSKYLYQDRVGLERLIEKADRLHPMVQVVFRDGITDSTRLELRIDLPVFAGRSERRHLSPEELEFSILEISRCAVDVLGWDVRDVERSPEISGSAPPSASTGKVGKHWMAVPGHKVVRLLNLIPCQPPIQVNETLQMSGRHPFLKFRAIGKFVALELPYYADDLQEDERRLLERWFDLISERIRKLRTPDDPALIASAESYLALLMLLAELPGNHSTGSVGREEFWSQLLRSLEVRPETMHPPEVVRPHWIDLVTDNWDLLNKTVETWRLK